MNRGVFGFPEVSRVRASIVYGSLGDVSRPRRLGPWDDAFDAAPDIDTGGTRHPSALPWTKRNFGLSYARPLGRGQLSLMFIGTTNNVRGMTIPAPSGDWAFSCRMQCTGNGINAPSAGLGVFDSVASRWETLGFSGGNLNLQRWDTITFNSTVVSVTNTVPDLLLRVQKSGTNVVYLYAIPPVSGLPNWITMATSANSAWLTSGPNHVGLAWGANGPDGQYVLSDFVRDW